MILRVFEDESGTLAGLWSGNNPQCNPSGIGSFILLDCSEIPPQSCQETWIIGLSNAYKACC